MTWNIPCPGSDRGRGPRVPGRDLPSHTPNGKVGNHAEMVRQVAVLVDVSDDAEGLGGQVLAQRDVVDGSPPLEAQARGGNRQVRPEGGLKRRAEAEAALNCVARSAG